MYYSQNTKSIKTVILSFDGVATSLSKLRFNYYRRFCKLYDRPLDIDHYFNQCNSFKTMYNQCPIPKNLMQKEALSLKVEEDLYAYSLNHGVKIQEGFDELYDLLKSKKMDLIYTSTHPKKYTDPLFVLTGSLYRPQQFYYDDLSVYEQYKEHPQEVLVIANDLPTIRLANKYRFNVIYYSSLHQENDEATIRCLAVIHHLIEAINLILDKWREPRHQYLLIQEGQSIDENYQAILKTTPSSLHPTISQIYESEQVETIIEEEITEEIQEEEVIETPTPPLPNLSDSEELFEKTMIFDFEKEELVDEEQNFTLEPLEDYSEDTHTDIDSILNELSNHEAKKVFSRDELKSFGVDEKDLYNEQIDPEETKRPSILRMLFGSFISALLDGALLLFIYLIVSIGGFDWLSNQPFFTKITQTIYHLSMTCFGSFAKSIGAMFNASTTLIEGIAAFYFVSSIFFVILVTIELIRYKKK